MNKSNKLLKVLVLSLACLGLTSCEVYNCRPTTMDKLKGTYQLKKYLIVPANEEGKKTGRNVDAIKDYQVVAYIIIDGSNKAKYYYEDKLNTFGLEEVDIEYTYDEENTDKVRYVEVTNTTVDNSKVNVNIPHGKLEKFGVSFTIFSKNLNRSYTLSQPLTVLDINLNKKSTVSVKYKKVSKDTSTDYVLNKTNKSTRKY